MLVVELDAVDTHPLRRSVLRDGTDSDVVEFDGDDLPTTLHLGVRHGDLVLAVSTWLVREFEPQPGVPAHQLRGMATEPRHRDQGLASLLLHAGLSRCSDAGSRLVWARARSTALGFYRRHGFDTVGAEFVDAATGLPHRTIVFELASHDARAVSASRNS